MFWYEMSTLWGLISYAKTLEEAERKKIEKYFAAEYFKITKHSVELSFDKKDLQYITDNELEYIKAIYRAGGQQNKRLKGINKALENDYLVFDGDKIINKKGACATITEEEISGVKYIRKKSSENNKSILPEFNIIRELNALQSGDKYVIEAVKNSFADNSYLMEYAYESLETYVGTNKLTLSDKLHIIDFILNSVIFIHTNDVLHRDLHPGNFLKVSAKADGAPDSGWRASDFGFAIHISDALAENNNARKPYYGRIDYVAPEQRNNLNDATVMSEVYSIGRLINFVMKKNSKKIYHELSDISLKCTKQDPRARYQSVAEVKLAFDAKRTDLIAMHPELNAG